MIYQHKNSIPELKDLSEQRYLMRLQQKQKEPIQQQFQQQSQYLIGVQDPYLNQINDNSNAIQIQQIYQGKSEQKQFVNRDFMEEFPLDKNQQSPFAHRTNQQRSKTISLMNYKEIRNNSQENNQKGLNTTSNQQGSKAFFQPQEINMREQQQFQTTSTVASNLINFQSPTEHSYKKYEQNLNPAYLPINHVHQQQILSQQKLSNQQNTSKLGQECASQSNQQAQYLNQIQTSQSSMPQYQINRTNNHQLNFLENQNNNNGVRSNSQQTGIDPSTNSVRGNSQQNNIDQRSNSQQGFHNYSVSTPIGIKQNYNHFLSQNQLLTNQTQGITNMTTTNNNNNSLESLIDLENKWSDIKRVHQNFQQRSLSNSSSSNSIAPNHRPNSSLNVSTNNNLSFINGSSTQADQGNSSKTFQNQSMPQTPFESKLEKQNSTQNNNNNKLIKKVVPLSKINLNSLIQTTGSNSILSSNQSQTSNSAKNNKIKLNLHGSFQEQMISDKSNPFFESQSLPGSTRGHHDSFQGQNYNQNNQGLNNSQSQSQYYEFDSRSTNQQNNQNYNKMQENGQNNNLSMNYFHQNNQYIDSGYSSHQISQVHTSSSNELYNNSIPKSHLNNANLIQQNIYQISQFHNNQFQNPLTTHQKCLSYQDLKPQQSFKSNSISIQENYSSSNQIDSNINKYQEFKVNNQPINNYDMNNLIINNQQQNNSLPSQNNNLQKYQNYSQSPNKTTGAYPNINQNTNSNLNYQQLIMNSNYIPFEQKQEINQFNNSNYQSSQFQYNNQQTANFKQQNSFNQDTTDQSFLQQNKFNQKPYQTSYSKENNENKIQNQDKLIQSPQMHSNNQRQNYRASPSSFQAQQAHNAQSKERKSPNSRNASDNKLRKKSQEEFQNVQQEQTKKKTYSEQQFEFMKQLIPTYSQNLAKKNLFSQALAQQKGSFDLNSVLPNYYTQNQLDFTPIQENASQNEIDNHLQAKYNEYKQRIQQQQKESTAVYARDNGNKPTASNIYGNQYIQQINSNQSQVSMSQKKRPSTFQNNNQIQVQKETQLKDHYQSTTIQEIIKDQRNYSNECNDKINLSQKLIDQENRNPNNVQVKQLDHEALLQLKQGLKHSNSQGQNEFLQMQIQLQQQYQSVNNGNASTNNQYNNQTPQQKTYSPRVNYKIISENIKKQKFGVVQKNEKIISNNQAEQSKKTYTQNTSQSNSNQGQSFFPDQLLVPISKSFIETKKIQTNSNVHNSEKSVNEMYENNKLNSNNLNAINKKNSKLTEIPIKQVVSKKILPKYQSVITDISEDLINNNSTNQNIKTGQQNVKTYQKTQVDEPKKKKLSITQGDLSITQNQHSQKIQQQAPQSTKYYSQQIGFQKQEVEKTTLKRQHSSSTSNTIYDPFKNIIQDQQLNKGQQTANQQPYSINESNNKLFDCFGIENSNQQVQNSQASNPSTNYNKIQCMPCNKNLLEAKQQKKEEQLRTTKGKVESKSEPYKDISQIQGSNKIQIGTSSKQGQQSQQQNQQPKTYSSFIIPNLVFN